MDSALLLLVVGITHLTASFAHIFSRLGGDFLAGLTVASMLIPQSISYASSLAKMNPVVGLFSASIPGAVYALLGTCRQLNVAPEASLSLLIGQATSDIIHADPHTQPEDAPGIALNVATIITLQVSSMHSRYTLLRTAQAGLITFALGFFRLGFIDVVLSRALLQGFISAIAVIIMMSAALFPPATTTNFALASS